MNSTINSARYIDALAVNGMVKQEDSRAALFGLLQLGIEPSPDALHSELIRRYVFSPRLCGALLADSFLVLEKLGEGAMA